MSNGLSALPKKILKEYGDGQNPEVSVRFWLLYIAQALKLYGVHAKQTGADIDQIITAGITATDLLRIFDNASAPLSAEFVAAEQQRSEVKKALAEVPQKTIELKKSIEALIAQSRADVSEVIQFAKTGVLNGIQSSEKSGVFFFILMKTT